MFWQNGEAHTGGLDRGLQFGDGHFTTLRISKQKPLWWGHHQQRLITACQRLAMPVPDMQQIETWLQQALAATPADVAKIIITRGQGGRGYQPAADAEPTVYISTSTLPALPSSLSEVGIAELKLARQPCFAGLKTLNRLEQVMLANERQQRGYQDLLVLDQQNYVVETCQGNLFWRHGKRWYTPSLTMAGVAGVARQVICEHNWLGEVIQGEFELDDVLAAEQVFTCNSVRGVVPIVRLNDKVLSTSDLPEQLNLLIE
ncbi:aminodeoxychorismate lyase [Idiomarina sp. OT37-5b]|uniref:aminodeoxychorismate lyase n=1 Tax=Idiomarina sp. OT37-5b TaxID=2100422 RepID=UPI000CFA1A2D|nr:aminodeoxychorismate lyase [Idiomarina sp. OT37-5b]AVJ55978.1 aminodeoxychorismate lyase [Idiomarina sp. OT37-5b]